MKLLTGFCKLLKSMLKTVRFELINQKCFTFLKLLMRTAVKNYEKKKDIEETNIINSHILTIMK